MRIRTRYSLFKTLIFLAIVVFFVSLYDIFLNDSDWFSYVMIAYVALAILALILYIGVKPRLDEPAPEPIPEPLLAPILEPLPEPMPVVEPSPPPPIVLDVHGPQHYRCPFCANTFALELTHLNKIHSTRMDCPYCSSSIRIPARPKVASGNPVDLQRVQPGEQAAFTCRNCGEQLRYTAPGAHPADRMRVHTCPHCGTARVVGLGATGAPA